MRKNIFLICVAIGLLVCLGGCSHSGKPVAGRAGTGEDSLSEVRAKNENGLIEVDVTRKYPFKKIRLQDIADVEYVPLETNEEFLCDGLPVYVDSQLIIYCMKKEGMIFLFGREGNALKKINRKGQGGEEYSMCSGATFDTANGELYINDMQRKRIFVYDPEGRYKRSFAHLGGRQYEKISSFDKSALICYSAFHNPGNPFLIISKKDGHAIKEFKLPYEKRLDLKFIEQLENGMSLFISTPNFPIVKKGADILLNEISSDTVYKILPDFNYVPLIAKTPPVQQMEPPIFLFAGVCSDRYWFLQTVKKEYNKTTQAGYPDCQLMYDKQTGDIYEYELENGDFPGNSSFFFGGSPCDIISEESEDVSFLRASELQKAYKEGRLKGRLKEIAGQMKEDDNPVLVFIKFKKADSVK